MLCLQFPVFMIVVTHLYKEKSMTYQAPIEHKTSPYLFRQNVQFQDAQGNIYTKTLLSPDSQFGEEIFKLIYKELKGIEVDKVLNVETLDT